MTRPSEKKRDTLKVMRRVGLPEYLKAARARIGVSQREIGRRSGLSAMTISNLEDGKIKKPNDEETLVALADAYEVDPREMALAAYGLHFEEDDSSSPRALDAVAAAS